MLDKKELPADPVYWLGFDCAHGGDLMPGMRKYGHGIYLRSEYRDIEYVKKEVTSLDKQLFEHGRQTS